MKLLGKASIPASPAWMLCMLVPAQAQTLSFAEPLRVDVRFGGEVTVELSSREEVLGWSFGVRHDPSLLDPLRASCEGLAAGAVNGGKGPDFVDVEIHPPNGAGITTEVIVSFSGTEVVPAGPRVGLARILYAAKPRAKKGMTARLEFTGELGQPPLPTIVILTGGAAAPAIRAGEVVFIERTVSFIRGDANGNGFIDIGDAVSMLNHLFAGQATDCEDAVDANDDGQIDISDAVYTLQFQFARGPELPPPYPDKGADPTPDDLDCLRPA